MRTLHIDPIFGISGDMMISALIDAGVPIEFLLKPLTGVQAELPSIVPVRKQQGTIQGIHLEIGACQLHLSVHDMETLIRATDADNEVKADALAMLEIILEAEAKVHGTTRDEVHLHELAHVDTLIDLLGVATGIRYFGIQRVYCGTIPHGRGFIKTAHGMLPNPPPVTLEILSDFPAFFCDEALEMTTPTGAAIVRHYVKEKMLIPPLEVERIGYGFGSYKTEKPDVLRLMIGATRNPPWQDP